MARSGKIKVTKEGWGWVEEMVRADAASLSRYSRLDGVRRAYTDEEGAEMDGLRAERDAVLKKQAALTDNSDMNE